MNNAQGFFPSWETTTTFTPEQVKEVRSKVIDKLGENESIKKVFLVPFIAKDNFFVIVDETKDTNNFALQLSDIYRKLVDEFASSDVTYHFDFDYILENDFIQNEGMQEVYNHERK